jgi:hypothetical protein
MAMIRISKVYKVFYQLPGKQFTFIERELTVAGLVQTHVFVTEVEACSLDGVYLRMQAEAWSPNGEVRELIQRLGLQHTSMSVNDVVRDSKGEYWQCLFARWRKLS